jgi:gamma-glutamyltranspeptidase/glutathione hydrolase
MVVSSQTLASEAGAEILKQGGNAIDAAIAVGYALAVVNPCCGNIGGGGFMTLRLASGETAFIDFRETAPASATRGMYLDAAGNLIKGLSLIGWKAVGVPGTPAGLELARERFATLPRAALMAPAIRLARDGFVLTRGDTDILERNAANFRRHPEAARIFLHADGSAYQPGERLIQADLARTLETIAAEGNAGFYQGRIADAVATAAEGALTKADLASYQAKFRAPLRCAFRGYDVIAAPPPSSGGVTICEILNILGDTDVRAMGFGSAAYIHTLTEAMRHAFLDRNLSLGDPDFVKNPVDRLLSPDYAGAIRAQIDPAHATPSRSLGLGTPPHEKPETTHFSVADAAGNAVAVTYTINGGFGAQVIAPGTGFLLNDEMDDFTAKPGSPNLFGLVQGEANAIAPGKRPLSSMAPTIITKDGKLAAVLGSPGGPRIITITLQVALNMIVFGMEAQEAVNAPRIHHQWLPDQITVEQRGLSPDTLAILRSMGHTIREESPWGAAEIIAVGTSTGPAPGPGASTAGIDAALSGRMRAGFLYGAHDDRRPAGAAIGVAK